MKIFLDTANISEIKKGASMGVIHGVTTNPSLVAKEGHKDYKSVVKEIANLLPAAAPISVEVVSETVAEMVADGKRFHSWAPDNVVVKLPMNGEGLQATRELAKDGIRVNMTLCFSPNQAILAAHAGAAFISPFVGRLDDIGQDGMQVVRDIVEIYEIHGFKTEVIAASIRHPLHCTQAAQAGAHIATIPYKVLEQMLKHPLTDIGIQRFLEDWKKSGASNQ
ncbi:fructose-6-phosphate aldolase [Dehalogenimonas etheniformans]|uniref:Probable transaldolase n=1 Tax=Dehalogenimonas etheniformans TaxID=1536648 RepID=A0A2P5P6S0_9CHLR|nr:fructose-6-phosphate aldolase [Dehalogenimonas etheniformans]PPD57993.1 fructose-6-phosphate aldolase [Dehalogenimonas etheniformans]QNT75342.1 fructose-6-phosphate aldolase [Dehalogenimonas etheniformans]